MYSIVAPCRAAGDFALDPGVQLDKMISCRQIIAGRCVMEWRLIYISLDTGRPGRICQSQQRATSWIRAGSRIGRLRGEIKLLIALYVAIGAQSCCYALLAANANVGKTPQESFPCY
jgi:hypothetical protein